MVNLNQAAIHVWREMIQVAANEMAMEQLLDQVYERAPVLRGKLDDVDRWVAELPPSRSAGGTG